MRNLIWIKLFAQVKKNKRKTCIYNINTVKYCQNR